MPRIFHALFWAAAMLMIACAEIWGLLAEGVTSTAILIVPIAAILSMHRGARRTCCTAREC